MYAGHHLPTDLSQAMSFHEVQCCLWCQNKTQQGGESACIRFNDVQCYEEENYSSEQCRCGYIAAFIVESFCAECYNGPGCTSNGHYFQHLVADKSFHPVVGCESLLAKLCARYEVSCITGAS